jgi:hypothetical protein
MYRDIDMAWCLEWAGYLGLRASDESQADQRLQGAACLRQAREVLRHGGAVAIFQMIEPERLEAIVNWLAKTGAMVIPVTIKGSDQPGQPVTVTFGPGRVTA